MRYSIYVAKYPLLDLKKCCPKNTFIYKLSIITIKMLTKTVTVTATKINETRNVKFHRVRATHKAIPKQQDNNKKRTKSPKLITHIRIHIEAPIRYTHTDSIIRTLFSVKFRNISSAFQIQQQPIH